MRRKTGFFLALLVCGPSFGELQALPKQARQYSIDEFLGTTNYKGASFSPAGDKLLVSSDKTGIYNAYAISIEDGGPVQLTTSTDDAIFAVSYFPNDERFLFMSDEGGNELSHIYVQEQDGTVADLTPGSGLKASFFGWADDDQSFLVVTNERDRRFFDLYEYDVENYGRELVYEVDGGRTVAAISPDKRYLALLKVNTNADQDLFLLDRNTKNIRLLTDFEGDVQNGAQNFWGDQTFSPDGLALYYTTDTDHEFTHLVRHDIATGEIEEVIKPDWDVSDIYFSASGKYLVISINNDASTELLMYEAATMLRVDLPDLPDADITSVTISSDEDQMAFYASNSRVPRDLFVVDLDGGEPRQLTSSLNPNLDPADLVEGLVVRFESYDGLEIPGILYRPNEASAANRVPALVWVHGGPGGQSRIGYTALVQYLVNQGYAIYAINNRGSRGYGKSFYHLDDRKHGEDDLDDVVESKEMLADTSFVDKGRIGIIGGSYGGYMVLAALTFRPDAFDVGVDMYGISNWHRTVTSIPPWWESFRVLLEYELGDFDDEEFFKAKSPLFHAEQIEKPLMVLQGANDARVLKLESDEIVEAVTANGVSVEYVVFDDEGHGFVKRENQARGYKAILDFLDRHLKAIAE